MIMKKLFSITLVITLLLTNPVFAKTVKQYYPNGKLSSVQVYDDDGVIKGPCKTYWENGRLRQKTWYKHGLPYLSHTWSERGVRLQ